jgi:hypothetical protein
LQEAPKIYFSEGQDDWVRPAVEFLRGMYYNRKVKTVIVEDSITNISI